MVSNCNPKFSHIEPFFGIVAHFEVAGVFCAGGGIFTLILDVCFVDDGVLDLVISGLFCAFSLVAPHHFYFEVDVHCWKFGRCLDITV